MMNLILILKNQNKLTIQLKQGDKIIDHKPLTISQGFDTLLISSIDKILVKNKIDRLSLKTFKIQGKLKPETVSSMILSTTISGLDS